MKIQSIFKQYYYHVGVLAIIFLLIINGAFLINVISHVYQVYMADFKHFRLIDYSPSKTKTGLIGLLD